RSECRLPRLRRGPLERPARRGRARRRRGRRAPCPAPLGLGLAARPLQPPADDRGLLGPAPSGPVPVGAAAYPYLALALPSGRDDLVRAGDPVAGVSSGRGAC